MLYHFIILSYGFAKCAKPQHYPLFPPRPPQKKDDINIKHPDFDPYNLPIWTLENYWKIQRLEDVKGKKTQQAAVVKETGVSGPPICAASSAFSHPFFFPLDPFHLR